IRTRAEEEEQEAAIAMPLVAGLAAAAGQAGQMLLTVQRDAVGRRNDFDIRSEEHTSELQSLMRISYAVVCLKKKHTHTSSQETPPHDHHHLLCNDKIKH